MSKELTKYHDRYDDSLGLIYRKYSLEPTRLYFLTLYLDPSEKFTGEYSFDVEAASDSHYQFTTREEGSIRTAIGAHDGETLSDAMARYLQSHDGKQLEAAVRFRCKSQHHYY